MNNTLEEMNHRSNLPYAKKWIQGAQIQMFNIVKSGHRHSLKAFLDAPEKILWMEFRTTCPKPSLSCPFSLYEDPVNFRNELDSEWLKLRKVGMNYNGF